MKLSSPVIYLLILILFVLHACGCGAKRATSSKTDEEVVNPAELTEEDEHRLQRTFMDAEKAKILDEYDQAIALFNAVLKLDPANHVAYYELARIYFSPKYNQKETALKHSTEAVKLSPNNKWYLMFHAEVLASLGKFDEPVVIYKKLSEAYPEDQDLYSQHAFFLIQAGKYNEAIAVYDKLEQISGVDEQLIEQKKRLYLRNSDIEGAAKELQKLIDAYPEDGRYYAKLAELYSSNGMQDKSMEVYEQLLKHDPNNPYALLALADAAKQKGDKLEYKELMVKAFSNRELGIEPKLKNIYPYIEYYELLKDDAPIALELADVMIQTHPEEPKALAIRGDLLYLMKKMEEALISYEQALKLDPDMLNVWQQILFISSDLQDYEGLLARSKQAKEYFPNQPIVYYFEGTAQQQLNNNEAARKAYEKALLMVADNKQLEAQIWANLGDVYHEMNNHLASDTSYERSLMLDNKNPYVLNNYSYYLSLRAEKLEKAREMSKLANDLIPNNTAFLDTYAWILYQLKDFNGAKEWQEKALNSGGYDKPVIVEHYGDILFQLGETESAIAQWQKALSLDPGNTQLPKKIAEKRIYEK